MVRFSKSFASTITTANSENHKPCIQSAKLMYIGKTTLQLTNTNIYPREEKKNILVLFGLIQA